ncbi:MAG TPA: TonB-dependent receptor [Terriglobales bacterium]|nr:TonB-dependent receptor [Terriglobales bacterium]
MVRPHASGHSIFHRALCLFGIFATLLIPSFSALAQVDQGTLTGTTSDPSGAVLPGSNITATNTATGETLAVTTNSSGLFVFPLLPVGTYRVQATHAGFANLSETIQITVGAKLNVNIVLPVATGNQTVNVTSEAPVVETTRSSVSDTVGDRQIQNLPTNGRNFLDFTLLTPGVVRDVRSGDLSFAGQRGTLNSLTVDGTDNNNTFFGQTLGRTGSGRAPYQFSEDAVQEFQVNTNGYSAELGRAGGAVINVVTKSGTNNFHGTAFEFFRDRGLNANDPIYSLQRAFAEGAGKPLPLKPGYHFNQFGGNVGGPVIKNKVFFFFDYDGQRNITGNPILVTLPTPVNPLQTAAVNYLSSRINNYNRTFNQDVYLGKGDWNISDREQLSARYNAQRFTGQGLENSGTTSVFEHTGASNVASDSFNVQLTSTLSPNFVNVGKFSYQRDHEPGQANSDNPEALVRFNGQQLFVGRNSFSPRETTIHRQEYGDTVSYVWGRHSLKIGADELVDKILNFFPGNFSGSYTFATLDDFGSSLLGQPVTAAGNSFLEAFPGAGTTGATTHPDLLQQAYFVQDDWRLTNTLTLNLGARYDLETVRQPTVQNPAALALGLDTSKIHNDYNNIAPRLGFAWQPRPDKQLVVRGGYGIFYANTPSILYGTALSNNGINVQTLSFSASAAAPLPVSYPNTLCGAPQAVSGCPPPAGFASVKPTILLFAKNYVQPYLEQYNLQVEYQIAHDTSLTLGYMGVHGVHIQRTRDINLAGPETPVGAVVAGTGQTLSYNKFTAPRPDPAFVRIFEFESNANSNYNGLSIELNKRFSNHFQVVNSYTWSHVIDDRPDATAVVPGTDDGKEAYDPLNVALDRASGDNDVRNRYILSGIWQLDDYSKGMNRYARALLGGWELAGIFNAQSGQPYTALVNTDLNNDGNSRNERAPGTARNQFNLPAIYTVDPRITKSIPISERVHAQLVAEAFNLLNHPNITGVKQTLYATSGTACGAGVTATCLVPQTLSVSGINAFGMPSAANISNNGSNVGRVLQLAAKITF